LNHHRQSLLHHRRLLRQPSSGQSEGERYTDHADVHRQRQNRGPPRLRRVFGVRESLIVDKEDLIDMEDGEANFDFVPEAV
jgi:hypothetical protein